MKNGLLFGLVAAVGAGILFLRGKKDMINQLEVNLESLSINKTKTRQAAFFKLFLDIRLRLFNPTPSRLSITHIFIEIYVNGQLAGSITKPDDFTIQSNTESKINFTGVINTFSIVNQVINLVQSQEPPEITAIGYVETSFGRVNFNKKFV